MRYLSIILGLCCAQFCFAQSFKFPKLADGATQIAALVPANWKAIDTVYGDLNNDGRQDLVLVLEYHHSVTERRAYGDSETELIQEFQKPRMLAIYFKNAQRKYVFALQNNNFMLRSEEGGALGEPFRNLKIEHNVLTIAFEGGSSWRWKLNYQFKYQNRDWILIQANNMYYNNYSGEMTNKDYDFGKRTITETTGNLFDKNQPQQQREDILYFTQLKTLHTFKKPWTWEVMKDEFL